MAKRDEQSPSPPPPVVTPTKGRHFVQGSEDGPEFLDPFNSERAIEPTGPPNTLTTIPTETLKPRKINFKASKAEARRFAERFKAGDRNNTANNASDSVREDQDGVPKPPMMLHTDVGLVAVRTGPNGEPVFSAGLLDIRTDSNGELVLYPPPAHIASAAPRDGKNDKSGNGGRGRTCPSCGLM